MVTQWLHNGYTMVTQWLHNGYTMVTWRNLVFRTRALAPFGIFIWKYYKKVPNTNERRSLEEGNFNDILGFVESGKHRLDHACAVGLGFGPLGFTRWAYICAICFFNVCLTSLGVTY